MLKVLASPASAPPSNALMLEPRIAGLMRLYFQVSSLGALPEAGGLLDQRGDHVAYFAIFADAAAEHRKNQTSAGVTR